MNLFYKYAFLIRIFGMLDSLEEYISQKKQSDI